MFSRTPLLQLATVCASLLTASLCCGQSPTAGFGEVSQQVNDVNTTDYDSGDKLFAKAAFSFKPPAANPAVTWDYEFRLEIVDSDTQAVVATKFVTGTVLSGVEKLDYVEVTYDPCGSAQAYSVNVSCIAKEQGLIGPANDWINGQFFNDFVNMNP